jgi:hypothetical protein
MDALTWKDTEAGDQLARRTTFDHAPDLRQHAESVCVVAGARASHDGSDHDQKASEAATASCVGIPQLVIESGIGETFPVAGE